MGLNIAVFVPEGIVLSSDSLAFLRQNDEGFEASSKRTFTVWNRFLVSFVGGGFINGNHTDIIYKRLKANEIQFK